jgi:hypothetical protein
VFPDLSADLGYHTKCSLTYRFNSEGGEEIGYHSTQQQPCEDLRFSQRNKGTEFKTCVVKETSVKSQRNQSSTSDGESFANSSGSISSSV